MLNACCMYRLHCDLCFNAYAQTHTCAMIVVKTEKKKKKGPGSHTRNGVRTHVCIRTLDLKSNALTTRPPWYIAEAVLNHGNCTDTGCELLRDAPSVGRVNLYQVIYAVGTALQFVLPS